MVSAPVSAPVIDIATNVRVLVGAVPDPELPFVTIEQLGILRDVAVADDGQVTVTITPTYTGCPAMDAIRSDIMSRLAQHGFSDAEIRTVWAPAWTTEWISESGREALREHGIAPPGRPWPVRLVLSVRCPRCGSPDTREIAHFGSTACKAIYVCSSCREPFDNVKPL